MVACTIRSRCFQSMKKNEEPHSISISFGQQQGVPKIQSFLEDGAAGNGLRDHRSTVYTVPLPTPKIKDHFSHRFKNIFTSDLY